MTAGMYEQLVAGCSAPSRGGRIETRDATISTSELLDRIDACARLLEQTRHRFIGVEASDPVAFLVGMYACSKAGRVCVPVSAKDPVRTDFINSTLALDLIVDGLEARRQPRDADEQAKATGDFDPEVVARSTVLLFTSGTTSNASKGVFMSGEGIAFICQRMNEAMGVDHTAREYVLAGIDHAFGFGRCHSVLSAGGQVILPNTLELRELIGQFEARGCNGLAVVPSLLSVMLDQFGDLSVEPFPSLAYVQTGAMRFSADHRRKMASSARIRTYLHYGLTEAMRATFLDMQRHPDKLHSEGRPFQGVELSIQDANGQILPSGATGEVCLRGASLALGYTDGERWRRVMRDGWFHTGDIGHVDADGFLVYEGRSADAMNINGNLIYPDDVEARLKSLFGNTPFTVFGLADPRGIKDDLLYIAYEGPDGLVTHADCVSHLRQLGFGATPDGLVAVAQLPRNRTGKVQRFLLRQQVKLAG